MPYVVATANLPLLMKILQWSSICQRPSRPVEGRRFTRDDGFILLQLPLLRYRFHSLLIASPGYFTRAAFISDAAVILRLPSGHWHDI